MTFNPPDSEGVKQHYVYGTTENLSQRDPFDFYQTDIRVAKKAIEFAWYESEWFGKEKYHTDILDTGAGTGVWGSAIRDLQTSKLGMGSDVRIAGVELDEKHFAQRNGEKVLRNPAYTTSYHADFLTWESPIKEYDYIIGNPPYARAKGKGTEDLATPFSLKSLSLLTEGGILVYLLRLNFITGVGRYANLFATHPLHKVYVCSRRPSFRGKGTNGHDYAIFIWKKGYGTPHKFPVEQFIIE